MCVRILVVSGSFEIANAIHNKDYIETRQKDKKPLVCDLADAAVFVCDIAMREYGITVRREFCANKRKLQSSI